MSAVFSYAGYALLALPVSAVIAGIIYGLATRSE